jgi:hypothetical protein
VRRLFDDTGAQNMGSGHKTVGPSHYYIVKSVTARYAMENEGPNHRPSLPLTSTTSASCTKHVRSGLVDK